MSRYDNYKYGVVLGLIMVVHMVQAQITLVRIDSEAEITAQRMQILSGDNGLIHSSVRRYDPRHVTTVLSIFI